MWVLEQLTPYGIMLQTPPELGQTYHVFLFYGGTIFHMTDGI